MTVEPSSPQTGLTAGLHKPPTYRKWVILVTLVCIIVMTCWSLNYFQIERPIARELSSDIRNNEYTLKGHYRYYVDVSTLILDLSSVRNVAPVDLFRGLFQSAEALHESGRDFDRILLTREGKAVFVINGADFSEIGAEYSSDQNPIYLIRTLPQKLHRPDGSAAFGSWEGGWLGVLGRQMEDANDAAAQWANGQ